MWHTRGIPVDAIATSDPPTRENSICPRRLRKAAQLFADKMGPGEYAIRGQTERVYYVNLNADVPCFCKDAEYNGGITCKHRLRAMMGEGDERILLALGLMLKREAEIQAEHLRSQRRSHRAART